MNGAERSTREVLDDHLALASVGDWRTDLERNVAEDVVVLTGFGQIAVQTIHYTVQVTTDEV